VSVRWISIGAALAVAGAIAGCSSSYNSSSSTSSSTTPTDPIAKAAQQLAQLQEGGPPSPDDPLVGQFTTVLNDVQPICTETPEHVANEIYNSQQDLEKNGKTASLLHIAQAFDKAAQAYPSSDRPQECAQFLAAYLVLAEQPGGQP
jgi:hypothetical protein